MAEWESLGIEESTPEGEASAEGGLHVDPALVEAAEELEVRLQDLLLKASSIGVIVANRSAAGLDWSASRLDVDQAVEASSTVSQARQRSARQLVAAASWLRALERSDAPDGPERGLQGTVRKHPVVTLLVSAGAGALLGILLRKLP